MNLYEIDNRLRHLWDKIIDQEGELTEEDIKALEELEIAESEKLKGYGLIIRETTSDIERVKAEMDRLSKISKQMQNKVNWLTERLSGYMQGHNIPEYKSLEVNITFRTSKSLKIDENVRLAKKWLKVETKPDKQAIKDFISTGGKVKGCELVTNTNIQIK